MHAPSGSDEPGALVFSAEERLRFALDAADLGEADLDFVSGLLVRSPRVDAMFGFAPGEAGETADAFFARIHPEDLPRVLEDIRRAQAGAEPFRTEYRAIVPGGEVRWIASNGAVAFAPDGTPSRLVGVLRDVTDRRAAEAALRASEERYRLATLAFRGFVYDWDVPSGRVVRSEGVHELLGVAAHEVEPTVAWWRERLHPDDRAACEARVEALVASGETRFAVELRVRHASGRWVWVAERGRIVRGEDGRPRRVVGTSIDVGEAKEAQEALRRSEERLRRSEWSLRAATRAARMYEWEIDLAAGEIRWGADAEAALDLPAGSLPGTLEATLAMVHPEDLAALRPRLEETFARGEDFEIEFRIESPTSGTVWVWSQGAAARDPSGRLRYVGVGRNVTDRKQAEQDLRRQVRERTQEAEQALARLFEAQKMEAIGQLTGGVAHDFNNLLAAVLSNLELLRKRIGDDPRALSLLDGAAQGAERGAALTQRLLAFARRQDLRVESVSVATLAAGMLELLRRSLGPTVRIETRVSADLPPVATDANQLELALLNLAVNARDAMPGGGLLLLSAQARRIDPGADGCDLAPGDYVAIAVTDDGVGMDAATLARAAEPFFTKKGVGKGTGLGLSMVHGLAVQSGGAMRIESAPGSGTRVELWLPQAQADAPRPPASAPRAADAPAPGGRPLRVLLVDDDALVRAGVAAMLEDLGHEVVEAGSGADALAALAAGGGFDLVVTDQAMPGMTGSELAARLRAERPALPVILASGYAEQPAPERGGPPRLAKPFRQHDLAEAIAAALAAAAGAPVRA